MVKKASLMSNFFGDAPRVQHQHHVHQVDRGIVDPDSGYNGNVEYWHNYAQNLIEDAKGITDDKNKKLTEEFRKAAERRAINAGLRAVIRYCLAELRKTNPEHPLLDKKNRERIFAEFEKEEMDKVLKANDIKEMWPRQRPEEYDNY